MDITIIVEAVLMLLVAAVTIVVIPYVKENTTIAQQEEINKWVAIAVSAAEQIYIGPGRGPEKKQYVIDWLIANNIKLDASKIDALIESAVYNMKNGILTIEAVEAE